MLRIKGINSKILYKDRKFIVKIYFDFFKHDIYIEISMNDENLNRTQSSPH